MNLEQILREEELRERIKDLEKRQNKAIEQLHSLACEQVHRQHGCFYPEIDIEDLREVIAILKGEE